MNLRAKYRIAFFVSLAFQSILFAFALHLQSTHPQALLFDESSLGRLIHGVLLFNTLISVATAWSAFSRWRIMMILCPIIYYVKYYVIPVF